jgi:hypothetical protein
MDINVNIDEQYSFSPRTVYKVTKFYFWGMDKIFTIPSGRLEDIQGKYITELFNKQLNLK